MDFGVVGLANLLSSDSHSNNGSAFASETGVADVTKHRLYGSGSLKQESTVDEDDYLRAFKLAKTTSSCPKIPCNNTTGLSEHHLQMLSFSSPNSQMLSFSSHNSQPVEIPFYPHSASATDRSPGYGCGGVNATTVQGVRGPFTASQWMELEHQALIYKYITANVPIPFYLLNPIRKALESSSISCFSLLRPSALGWGADFHLRFSNTDPEPGRCRRTDGKKWRCSRDAVPDQKYCERHMNRGRHRSRKPVEGQPGHSASGPTGKPLPAAVSVVPAGGASKSLTLLHHPSSYIESSRSEFGSVSSDSLLNPLSKNSPFINCGDSESLNDGTQLSIAITSDFMSSNVSQPDEKLTASPLRLSIASDQTRRQNNWVPISWEPSIGGPLGEALHTTTNNTDECKNSKALNLIENWDHSTRFGLYRGPYGSVSNSSAGSSPSAESSKVALDGPTFYNGLIGPGLVLPSLPAL